MTFTELIYGLGDVFEATFTILPKLGNLPNYTFIVVGIIGLVFWLNLQVKYNKAASRNHTRQ